MIEEAPWSMTENGEWILNEPYLSILHDIKVKSGAAWLRCMCKYLSEVTQYPTDMLACEFARRSIMEEPEHSVVSMVESFIIEALEGSLV